MTCLLKYYLRKWFSGWHMTIFTDTQRLISNILPGHRGKKGLAMPLAPSDLILALEKSSIHALNLKLNPMSFITVTSPVPAFPHRSSPLITTYPEGIYILKIIKPPHFWKEISVLSKLQKSIPAPIFHYSENILTLPRQNLLFFVLPFVLAFKTYWFCAEKDGPIWPSPQHSLSTVQTWTKI